MPSCTEVEKSRTVETTITLNCYKDPIPYSTGVDWLLRASAADGVFAGPSLVLPRWVGASPDREKRARGQMRRSTGLAVWSWNHGAHFVSWIGTSRPNSLLSGGLHGAGPFGVGRTFGSHGCISAALERVLLCKGKTGGARRTYTLRRRYSWQRPSEQVPHPAWAPALWPKIEPEQREHLHKSTSAREKGELAKYVDRRHHPSYAGEGTFQPTLLDAT